MKKYYFLIIVALILGLVLTGCSLLSNIGQAPATGQSGITYLTKAMLSPDDLVGLWHFDGDAKDSSGDANTGYVYGGANYVDSPMGMALSFDGSDDYVEVYDSPSLEPPTTITVEAWVKNFGTPGTFKYIISKVYAAKLGSYSSYAFYTGASGGLRFYVGFTSIWVGSPDAGVSLWDSKWHHIAGTYDGSEVKLFVDGSQVVGTGTSATPTIAYDAGNLYIGYYGPYNYPTYFPGFIDEVRIWKVALSSEQLGEVYDFDGFYPPVENLPTRNVVKAGRAIPVKFSLSGDQGLNIFEDGYPKSWIISCSDGTDPFDDIEETVNAGGSSLNYDATADQYTYVWKTEKTWANSCRKLVVVLDDGTYHEAYFTFK